jgi:hypothetical protein
MWEFLSRKKETPAPLSETSAVLGGPKAETAPSVDVTAEQAAEQVGEKYSAILTQAVTATSAVPQDIDADVENVGQEMDSVSRVTQLVELAQVKGVAHAVAVARKLNDFYVLDTMHDELADKLYDALKAKGLIEGE